MRKFKFAVIGKDVTQSSSPRMHTFIAKKLGAEIEYDNISVPPEEFSAGAGGFFEKYDGFNVTIPFKLDVIPFLSSLEGDAAAFGAVNTVISSTRKGYNTDGLGFMLMLKNSGVDAAGKSVLLLGAGGAGRSAAKKLKDGGALVTVFDKRERAAKDVAEEFGVSAVFGDAPEVKPYDIIINATGVGMHKTVGISPVDEELISLCNTAIDLIYVPPKSKFLEIAESLGKKILNGMSMLFYQAYFAECIYLGLEPHDGQAKALFEEYEQLI